MARRTPAWSRLPCVLAACLPPRRSEVQAGAPAAAPAPHLLARHPRLEGGVVGWQREGGLLHALHPPHRLHLKLGQGLACAQRRAHVHVIAGSATAESGRAPCHRPSHTPSAKHQAGLAASPPARANHPQASPGWGLASPRQERPACQPPNPHPPSHTCGDLVGGANGGLHDAAGGAKQRRRPRGLSQRVVKLLWLQRWHGDLLVAAGGRQARGGRQGGRWEGRDTRAMRCCGGHGMCTAVAATGVPHVPPPAHRSMCPNSRVVIT